jgi:hypothetical protein
MVGIINRKQHVEGREKETANSYQWWCFGYRHRQSCDIARPQGNCVALHLPLHNCGAMVPTVPQADLKQADPEGIYIVLHNVRIVEFRALALRVSIRFFSQSVSPVSRV